MNSLVLFFYTESPLHAGTGSSVSTVDLPIQRERATQFPIVQGSGVKGALRSQATDTNEVNTVFGPETNNAADHAGAISVGEARIALFPVRSLVGIFAYVTSPLALSRLGRSLQAVGAQGLPDFTFGALEEDKALRSGKAVDANGHVVLEEFAFAAKEDAKLTKVAQWLAQNAFPAGDAYSYWHEKVQSSLVLLPDNAFRDFVQNSTEIATHVKLEVETKTVAHGALWTTESLPADSLLFSHIVARKPRGSSNRLKTSSDVSNWLTTSVPSGIQLGGDETTGQGMVALRWVK
ncbi:MAG TPA: type III-B CRISPR module RAMP protein Cmr4 [Aggregatilineales bacterium]|nr:type III-B CRISPR module RAMP protein Cmr4 [Anaerolineales bacterium]HRE46690.1 type III-B CRISPR module RAMP protein Cmr4 [Aggregatilineales bacterium]